MNEQWDKWVAMLMVEKWFVGLFTGFMVSAILATEKLGWFRLLFIFITILASLIAIRFHTKVARDIKEELKRK